VTTTTTPSCAACADGDACTDDTCQTGECRNVPFPDLTADGLRCGLDNLERAYTAANLCTGTCARIMSRRLAQLDDLFTTRPASFDGRSCRRWTARSVRALRRLDRAITTRQPFGPDVPVDRDVDRLRTRLRAFGDAGCPHLIPDHFSP